MAALEKFTSSQRDEAGHDSDIAESRSGDAEGSAIRHGCSATPSSMVEGRRLAMSIRRKSTGMC
ncbi:hypothetical protein [Saccharopolyspora halophila]